MFMLRNWNRTVAGETCPFGNLALNATALQKVFLYTVKPVKKRPLKNRQSKGLKVNGSLMKVESIAECSLGAFGNTFDLH